MAEYFYGITDKGKRRDKNEDTFFAREITHKRFAAACVIDGVGGYKGGDVAAAIARSVIIKSLETLEENIIETLREAVITANIKINQEQKAAPKNERMACVLTCVVTDIKKNKCWYAHVGDTRIYLLRDESLVKISKDHSDVGFLEESGRLSEEEAMRHPRRNEINKALGFEEDISTPADFIETGESPFLPGDTLLLCSDGLTDMINADTIMSVLITNSNLHAKAKALVDAANNAGGKDNITAVLIENRNWPKKKHEPVPVERKKSEAFSSVEIDEIIIKQEAESLKKSRRPFAFFILLLIVLVAVLFIVAFRKNNKPVSGIVYPIKILATKNQQPVQLLPGFNDSSRIFVLHPQSSALEIAAPIVISKDSFRLVGNGTVLKADSAYTGPAFVINAKAKHIVLDSVVLEDFDVGVVVQKNNITFRHVRFVNCKVPIQYAMVFSDSVISGKFKDSIFITH